MMHNHIFTRQWAEIAEFRLNRALGIHCTHCGSALHTFRGEQKSIGYSIAIYQCHSCGSSFGGPRYQK